MQRRSERTLYCRLAALLAIGAISAFGCGNEQPANEAATSPQESSLAAPTESNAFALTVADLFVAIARAGTDACALAGAVPERPMIPPDAASTTLSVGLHVTWIRAVTASEPAPIGAEDLNRHAQQLMDAAVAAGFPVDFWASAEAQRIVTEPTYVTALGAFDAATKGCENDTVVAVPTR